MNNIQAASDRMLVDVSLERRATPDNDTCPECGHYNAMLPHEGFDLKCRDCGHVQTIEASHASNPNNVALIDPELARKQISPRLHQTLQAYRAHSLAQLRLDVASRELTYSVSQLNADEAIEFVRRVSQ